MILDLSDEQTRTLLNLLIDTIEADRYPFSPRSKQKRGSRVTKPDRFAGSRRAERLSIGCCAGAGCRSWREQHCREGRRATRGLSGATRSDAQGQGLQRPCRECRPERRYDSRHAGAARQRGSQRYARRNPAARRQRFSTPRGGSETRAENVEQIMSRLRSRGVQVIMLENQTLGAVPTQYHQPDGQHLTPEGEGYRQLASWLLPQVASALGLPASWLLAPRGLGGQQHAAHPAVSGQAAEHPKERDPGRPRGWSGAGAETA